MSTVSFSTSYVEKIAMCLRAHAINLSKPGTVFAAQNYLEQLSGELLSALQNHAAASADPEDGDGISVEWCEMNMAFAVMQGGKPQDFFPTRKEAERFAGELSTSVRSHDKKAAQKPCH